MYPNANIQCQALFTNFHQMRSNSTSDLFHRVCLHTSDETANRYDLWTYGCHAIRYRNWMKEVYVNIISTVKGMDSGINSIRRAHVHTNSQ